MTWARILELLKIIAAVSAIPALLVAIYAVIDARKTADRSGQFNRPELRLLLGQQVISDGQVSAYYRVSPETAKIPILIGEIPFGLANFGRSSAELAVLAMNFFNRDGFSPAIKDLNDLLKRDGPFPAEVSRDVSESGDSFWVQYTVGPVLPRMEFSTGEPFAIPVPLELDDISIVTSDNVTGTMDTVVSFSINIPVTLMSKDFGSFAATVSFGSIVAADDTEFYDRVKILLDKNIESIRENMSVIEYIWQGVSNAHVYIYVINLNQIYVSDDRNFAFMKADSVDHLSLPLFSWSRIFR